MNTCRFVILCLAFLGSGELASIKSSTSIGKDFLFALFPEEPSVNNVLFITSWSSGECHVTFNEDIEAFMHIEVHAQLTTTAVVSAAAQVSLLKTEETKAVRIECNVPVSIYVGFESGSSNIALILPVTSLSDTYFIPGLPRDGFIGVVSADDGNRISVKLNSRCTLSYKGIVHSPGEAVTVALNALYVLYLSIPNCDLGGTIVQSTHPVAVFSGSRNIVKGSQHSRLVCAQALPYHMWDNNYVVPEPLKSINTRIIRILAWSDSTLVRRIVKGQPAHRLPMLDAGQFVDEILLPNETYAYSSNQKVSMNLLSYNSVGSTYKSVPGLNLYQKRSLIPKFSAYSSFVLITNKEPGLGRVYVYPKLISTIRWLNFTLNWSRYSIAVFTTSKDGLIINTPTTLSSHAFSAQVSGHVPGGGDYLVDTGYGDHVFSKDPDLDSKRVRMSCGHDRWKITLNMTSSLENSYRTVFPLLRLGRDPTCKGKLTRDRLVFETSTHDCNTVSQMTNGGMLYKNTLTLRNKVLNKLYCYSRNNTPTPSPTPSTSASSTPSTPPKPKVHEVERYSGEIPEPVVRINLYEDARYRIPLPCCPITVGVATVFVEVVGPKNLNLVTILKDCYLNTHRSTATFSRLLIQDRCGHDPSVQLLGTTSTITKFSFRITGLHYFRSEIALNCDYQFCKMGDQSDQCRQSCVNI